MTFHCTQLGGAIDGFSHVYGIFNATHTFSPPIVSGREVEGRIDTAFVGGGETDFEVQVFAGGTAGIGINAGLSALTADHCTGGYRVADLHFDLRQMSVKAVENLSVCLMPDHDTVAVGTRIVSYVANHTRN